MFQHIFRAQNLPEGIGGLLNDGGVGDDVHDALHTSGFCLGQSKGQRGHCFAAAGGDGQGEEPGRSLFPLLNTLRKNGAAPRVQIFLWREPPGYVCLEAFPKLIHRRRFAIICGLPSHECTGIGIVCVHQTGEQHAGEEHTGRLVFLQEVRHSGGWQRQLLLPDAVIIQLS